MPFTPVKSDQASADDQRLRDFTNGLPWSGEADFAAENLFASPR